VSGPVVLTRPAPTAEPAVPGPPPVDVLHLRIGQDDDAAGVSLAQARALLTGVTRLWQAAAMSVIGPGPRFAGRRPDVVRSFVERDLRFSHPATDSPVLAVHTLLGDPVEAVPARGTAGTGGPAAVRLAPFQRRVGMLLAAALGEVASTVRGHRAANDSPTGPAAAPAGGMVCLAGEGELPPLVLRGVSADLCDALIGMVTAPRVRLVEFSFYWAPRRGLTTPPVTRVALRDHDAAAVRGLRDDLAASRQRPRTAVYGQVTRLDRGDRPDGGVATIHGVVGQATPRTVQVAVAGPEYDDAIRAYQTRVPVVATGRLHRAGGVHVLTGRLAVP
jgi:hypothetical protein